MTGEERAPRKTKLIVVALVISLIACSFLLGGAIYIHAKQESELKQSLIENCQKSPVREALTEILEEEIAESHGPLLGKFAEALNITLAEAERITDKSNAKKEERIDQIEPSDCEAQYQ